MRLALVIAANVAGWPVIQLAIAWGVTQIRTEVFANELPLYQVWRWEVRAYQHYLGIRRWKDLLPDGSSLVGGRFPKKMLEGRSESYLRRFVIETRRGEVAHWLMLLCCPVFFLWNPFWAWGVMALYALGANLPCILVQRYNRAKVQAVLRRIPESGNQQKGSYVHNRASNVV